MPGQDDVCLVLFPACLASFFDAFQIGRVDDVIEIPVVFLALYVGFLLFAAVTGYFGNLKQPVKTRSCTKSSSGFPCLDWETLVLSLGCILAA